MRQNTNRLHIGSDGELLTCGKGMISKTYVHAIRFCDESVFTRVRCVVLSVVISEDQKAGASVVRNMIG